MKLSALLNEIYPVDPSWDVDILELVRNSREVLPGFLFLACLGKTFDGRLYIDEALAKGASAVLAEAEGEEAILEWRNKHPVLYLPELGSKLPELAARFYHHPVKKLKLIGITGTNGKTSCSHFIAQCLQKLHLTCGVIGTLGSGIAGKLKDTLMTTPDPVALQKIFSEFVEQKAQYAAMEVSSHSLDQGRIKGLAFEVGVFTNLTQDHLDYHGTMAAYGAAKQQFFTDYLMRQAVINADDVFGRELMALLPPEKVLAYSVQDKTHEKGNWVYTRNLRFELSGLQAEVFTPWGEGELRAPLIGEFNLSNVLAVLATLGVLGIPLNELLAHLAQLKSVPGRMQIFGGGEQPSVIVDYAHTPDALEKTLRALRKHCRGKLACLFGCGGDRDKGKRPLMGAIAEQYADLVMLTDDNPRHEESQVIIAEILAGLKKPEKAKIQGNRSKAIQDIIQCAGAGDYVLIAGKGAETYQQVGDEKLPFNDGEKIMEILGKNQCYYG